MNEMEMRYALEKAAFNEKIALGELEVSKAEERVRELKYDHARFQLEWLTQVAARKDRAQDVPATATN